jgi:phosphatidylserine synthase
VRVGPSSPVIALSMNSIRHFLTPANAITSAGLAAGFLALLAIVDAQIWRATIWVIVAAVLDSLDGAVARRGSGDQRLGRIWTH